MAGLEAVPIPGGALWLDASVRDAWSTGLPRAGDPGVEVMAHAGAAGRGALLRVPAAGASALVRRYRRGGWLRRVLPDRFLLEGRAHAEVLACARLAPEGLAPTVLGLEIRGAPLREIRLATREVEGAVNLRDLVRADPTRLRDTALAREVGRAIRAMHEAGVAHADLHVGNVLVLAGAPWRALLVDLDGARVLSRPVPLRRRVTEILRLCRSVEKWEETSGAGAAARGALLRACLPRGSRLGLLRSARRLWAWRRRVGLRPAGAAIRS